ncbi:MAG: glycoside hydrolase family 30 protein [Fusobacteriota bacterium]
MRNKMKKEIYISSKDTDKRLTKINEEEISSAKKGENKIIINPEKEYQKIIGFGGAFTEAGSTTIDKLPNDLRQEVIDAYFHPKKGINYNFCRTHINSCDFSLGNYAYVEKPGDTELETFSIDRDKKSLIPFIKDAVKSKGEEIKLFASPWSPPAWMKTNGRMNNGGSLKKEYYDVWAKYFARYIKEYKKEGIDIWGVSIQNEPMAITPWDNCIYTSKQEKDFVKVLGPTLKKEGLEDKKIIVWDHNKDIMKERMDVMFSDEEAAKWVWGAGFHWYGNDDTMNLTDNKVLDYTHEKYGTNLVFTEGCNPLYDEDSFVGEWWTGEKYGVNIINDLNHWTTGWCDWNMVLNEKGGPNHVGNYCDAPIIVDTKKNKIHYNSPYYYLGHFSKFILPGAVRINTESNFDSLQKTAVKNKDGSIVLVVINKEEKDISFSMEVLDEQKSYVVPGRSIITIKLYEN